jgi:endogenous inhibitor of DNA gyrase (YacG/DUF329 family)
MLEGMSGEKTAHCPYCGKPVMSEGLFNALAKFKIKCPWCQEPVQVQVVAKIIVTPIEKFQTAKQPARQLSSLPALTTD